MRKSRLLSLLSAAVVAGGAGVAAFATPAGARSEFTVLVHPTNLMFVTSAGASLVRPGPLVPGDRIIRRNDISENGSLVGYSNVVCTVTFNDNLLCDTLIAINGVGDIHAATLLRGAVGPSGPPQVFDATVDGGTFGYRTAHGSAHLIVQPGGDQNCTFTLD